MVSAVFHGPFDAASRPAPAPRRRSQRTLLTIHS